MSACLLLRPRSLSGVLLTCEHASNRLPASTRPTAEERRVLRDHWGWDPGAWTVTRGLSAILAAGAVGGRWSRLVVDLNRRVDDSTLIREEAGGVALRWNRDLSPMVREERVREFHAPYHEEIDRQIVRRRVRGLRPLLLAVHTFAGVWNGRRRSFDLGVLYDAHAVPARRLASGLRDAGFRVRYNEPYSGRAGMMYSAHRHGTHHGLPCLELEVNQDLVADASGASRIARAVAPVLATVAGG